MSDGEGFLARWSRRKHAAAPQHGPVASPSKHADAQPQAGMAVVAPQSEPVVDLAELPSIEAIGVDSDIRAFLAPGVPATLVRATGSPLRAYWSVYELTHRTPGSRRAAGSRSTHGMPESAGTLFLSAETKVVRQAIETVRASVSSDGHSSSCYWCQRLHG